MILYIIIIILLIMFIMCSLKSRESFEIYFPNKGIWTGDQAPFNKYQNYKMSPQFKYGTVSPYNRIGVFSDKKPKNGCFKTKCPDFYNNKINCFTPLKI